MSDKEKVFVILDPTTMEQPSLIMAESIAKRGRAATLHVYCCIDEKLVRTQTGEDSDQARTDKQERVSAWIERLVTPTRALGLTVDTEVEISKDWRKSTVAAVARQNCMLAIKSMPRQKKLARLFRDTADWHLLRDSACPVYLVKSASNRPVRKVLAAIKHRTEKKLYTEANEMILQITRGIATGLDAEMFVVTAYKDNFHYPDRQKFADRCGLPRNQVRAVMGNPQEAIATAAKEIGADLVVIARVGKPGAKHDVGHTAEKVIGALDANILVLPMNESS
jgi:nucleotide-binding universal stress UspA family protein